VFCCKLLTLRVIGESESRRLHFLTALSTRLTAVLFLLYLKCTVGRLDSCVSSLDITPRLPVCPCSTYARGANVAKLHTPSGPTALAVFTRVRMTRGTRVDEMQIDSFALHKRKNARSERNLTDIPTARTCAADHADAFDQEMGTGTGTIVGAASIRRRRSTSPHGEADDDQGP